MQSFTYQNGTKIIFGPQTELTIGEEIKPYASKVLLHYGGGSIKTNGLYDRIISSLSKQGIEIVELSGVRPNPRVGLVREGINLCKEQKIGRAHV